MADAIRTYRGASVRETYEGLGVGLTGLDFVVYWYLNTWLSRQMVSNLNSERGYVESRLPFIDRSVLSLLLRAPPSLRSHAALQIETVQRINPAMARVRNVNTGAPLGAGKLSEFLYEIRARLASKLKVPGYQHYSPAAAWLRGAFVPSVREVLLDSRTLERGLFNRDTLKKVVDEYTAGATWFVDLITPMMTIELWFRRVVDGRSASGLDDA